MSWQPTCELRWIVRHFSEPYKDTWNIRLDEVGNVETERKWDVHVLQQKWINRTDPDYYAAQPDPTEWRDVPIGEEAK